MSEIFCDEATPQYVWWIRLSSDIEIISITYHRRAVYSANPQSAYYAKRKKRVEQEKKKKLSFISCAGCGDARIYIYIAKIKRWCAESNWSNQNDSRRR